LAGTALALHRLHADSFWPGPPPPTIPDEFRERDRRAALRLEEMLAERQDTGRGWAFARLIAPWIAAKSCMLPEPAPWFSWPLHRCRFDYARAAVMREGEWERWLCGTLAEGWNEKRRLLPALRRHVEDWTARVMPDRDKKTKRLGRGRGRRPGRGGPVAVIRQLVEQPVVTTDWLAKRIRVSGRAVQGTMKELVDIGIVHELTDGWNFRLYEAVWGTGERGDG
jgi:hypothetical protein